MINNEYSFQFLKHSEVFATREDAMEYINDNFRPDALLAEPAAVFYGDVKKPNLIIAVGVGNKKVFLIDTAKLSEDIAAVSGMADGNHDDIAYINSLVNNIVTACGLDYDQNKKEDQITYKGDVRDAVIGEAKSLMQAIQMLSNYVQEHVSENTIEVKDTKSVELVYKEGKDGGKELLANVKISTEGDDDDMLYNDNIVGIKPDGIFAAVNLRYDADGNRLIFTTSGMKNGKYVTDAKRQSIALPDAPTAKTVPYKNRTVFDALNQNEKDIECLQDIDVEVDSTQNTLTLSIGDFRETVKLPGLDIVQSVEYRNGNLVFRFRNGSETIVPIDNFFRPYHFSENGPVALVAKALDDGSSLVEAQLKLRPEDNAITIDKDGYLYVPVSKSAADIDAIVDKINEEIQRALDAEQVLRDAIGKEVTDRTAEITRVEGSIESAVRTETDRAMAAENLLRTDLNAEIAERRADVNRVETEVVPAARQFTLDKVAEEADRAKEAERANAAAIAAEQSRAEQREIELSGQLASVTSTADTAVAKVETVKADLQTEIDRAKAVEEGLKLNVQSCSEAVAKEIADRKAADAVHDTQIKANTDKLAILDGTKDQVGSIRNIIDETNSTVNQSIEIEKQRAEAAETALGARIDNLVTSNAEYLVSAKDYTDQQITLATIKIDKNTADIASNTTEIAKVNTELNSKVENVELKQVDGQDLTYQLLVDGNISGTINIPRDNFFKNAEFDAEKNVLILTFSVPDSETDKSVRIDMGSLVQIYHAGQGLDVDGTNTFFIKKNDAADEGYLVVDNNGICIQGINAALSHKADVNTVYTKGESDAENTKIRGEFANADAAIRAEIRDLHTKTDADVNAIDVKIDNEVIRATGKEADLDTKIEANRLAAESGINELNSNLSNIQSIANSNTTSINAEVARATEVENRIEGLVNAAEAKIDTINGGIGTPGSIANSVNTVKTDLETKITAETNRAQKEENDIRTLIAANKVDVEDKITDSVANSKTYVDNQLNTLEPRVTAVENEVKTKVGDIQLVHAADSLSYTILVDGKEIGTINTNEIGGLQDVFYQNGVLTMVFLVNGETKTIQIDLGEELTDIYEAGNGIRIENHIINVIKDGTSEEYLFVSESGIGIRGVDKAIGDAVKVVDDKVSGLVTQINNAESSAENAKVVAEAAKTAADEAKILATEAKNGVDDAQSDINSARREASEAKTLATEAKSTVDTAKTIAENAQSTATTAMTTANTAQTAAAAAQSKADQNATALATLQDTVRTQGETIATLLAQIEKLETELAERTDFGIYSKE